MMVAGNSMCSLESQPTSLAQVETMKTRHDSWRNGNYLSAFRVRPRSQAMDSSLHLGEPNKPLLTVSDSSEQMFRPRRAHRKSRTGCMNCKRRRVKCDETKPQCRRCRMHGALCDFALPRNTTQRRPPTAPSKSSTSLQCNGSFAFSAMTANIDHILQSGASNEKFYLSDPCHSLGSFGLAMLGHFSQMVSVHSPAFAPIKKVMREFTIQLALGEPCLLYSIMAVASTHWAYALPSDRTRTIAATRCRHKATRIYRQHLQLPIGRDNMDMLITSCILLGMFSFAAETRSPLDSWVFSDDPVSMNWLSVQCGLRCLLEITKPWMDDSIWNEPFQESSNYEYADDHRMGREDLDPELADLCDITDTTTEEINPYHWPLRMLCPLLRIPRHKCGASRITNFMGRLLPDFVNLLAAKEPRALLILSYWLALMSTSVDEWWVGPRVTLECRAICMYLEACGDRRVIELLDFPARSCGYKVTS